MMHDHPDLSTKKGIELTSAAKAQLGTAFMRENMLQQAQDSNHEYLLDFKSETAGSQLNGFTGLGPISDGG